MRLNAWNADEYLTSANAALLYCYNTAAHKSTGLCSCRDRRLHSRCRRCHAAQTAATAATSDASTSDPEMIPDSLHAVL